MRPTASGALLVLLSWLLAPLPLLTGLSGTATASPQGPEVVIAAVPDLRWADASSLPALRRLAADSAVGSLADKTEAGTTGCLAGLLTLDSGSRSSAPDGTAPTTCGDADPVATARLNARNPYAVDVTALGTALAAAGVVRVAAGPLAATVLAGPAPPVSVPATDPPEVALTAAERVAGARPLAAALVDPVLLDPGPRAAALRALDGWIGALAKALPPTATLLLVGSSDSATGTAHLHVALAHGPDFAAHSSLTSATTGRTPYAELVDVAPTVARWFGASLPAAAIGASLRSVAGPAPTVSALVDADRHAVADVGAAVAIRAIAIILTALALLLWLIALCRPGWRPPASVTARLAAPVALLSWLAQLVPWWRAGVGWLTGAVLAVAVAYALVMTVARRRGLPPVAELVAVPVVALITLVVDQLAGGGLQLSAPLGDDPLEAGRFTGVGNTDFAVLVASGLLVAAVLAARARSRPRALLLASVVLAVVVIIDGAPPLGDDLGGVLAAAPAALVLLLCLARLRISPRRLVVAAGIGVALAVAASAADYARPVADQTHLGHFVGQVLHGGAWITLHRKILDTLKLQGELPLILAVAGYVTRRRWLPGAVQQLSGVPGTVAASAAIVVAAVLGALFNDSGVTVAVFCFVAVLPGALGALADVTGPVSPAPAAATAAS